MSIQKVRENISVLTFWQPLHYASTNTNGIGLTIEFYHGFIAPSFPYIQIIQNTCMHGTHLPLNTNIQITYKIFRFNFKYFAKVYQFELCYFSVVTYYNIIKRKKSRWRRWRIGYYYQKFEKQNASQYETYVRKLFGFLLSLLLFLLSFVVSST